MLLLTITQSRPITIPEELRSQVAVAEDGGVEGLAREADSVDMVKHQLIGATADQVT
jgi:hypothetical protein